MMAYQKLGTSAHPTKKSNRAPQLLDDLRDWLMVAWVVWWSWAYVRTALAQRFPHVLGWTRTFW